MSDEEWVECYDPIAEETYYYCHATGESTDDPPEDYISAQEDPTFRAVIKIQCLGRKVSYSRFFPLVGARRADIIGYKHKGLSLTQECTIGGGHGSDWLVKKFGICDTESMVKKVSTLTLPVGPWRSWLEGLQSKGSRLPIKRADIQPPLLLLHL